MEVAPEFFATPAQFRAWLKANHKRRQELWVGFYKRDSGMASITWPESVDVALCYGWIDGVRKSLGEKNYMIRFTPRKARSKWSAVNLKRVRELIELRLMRPAGLKAFTERKQESPGAYSYEQRNKIEFDAAQEKLFRANEKAWAFYQSEPNWYRRTSLWWVVSAKKEETRLRRLNQLIQSSEQGRTIAPLTRKSASDKPG